MSSDEKLEVAFRLHKTLRRTLAVAEDCMNGMGVKQVCKKHRMASANVCYIRRRIGLPNAKKSSWHIKTEPSKIHQRFILEARSTSCTTAARKFGTTRQFMWWLTTKRWKQWSPDP